jgi:hypothetical protein
MTGTAAPLYVVCSPCRCVGKTLVARLIAELHLLDERPVAAFDLADEGPQLADYLPEHTTVADIGDTLGQMAFFDRLIDEGDGAKVIDVSHRAFKTFFDVVQAIGFFEEARRRAIAPLILYVVDQDPKAVQAYSRLRRSCTAASLLPVRNQAEASELPDYVRSPNRWIAPASLDIALIGFSLRALIDRPAFSFADYWRAASTDLSEATDDELMDWTESVFLQLRAVEHFLAGDDPAALTVALQAQRSRKIRRQAVMPPAFEQAAIDVPEQVRKFAPKRLRDDISDAVDHAGDSIINKLHAAAGELRAAEDRIDELETEVVRCRDRAARAETWLQVVREEIEKTLITSTTAKLPKPMT